MNAANWIDQVKAWPVLDVATRVGLEARGRSFVCPACGKGKRHKGSDKRLAAGLTPDGGGWRCHAEHGGCGVGGSAVDLIAWLVMGTDEPSPGEWADVRRACVELSLCDADARDGQTPAARAYTPPTRPPAAPPVRPPAGEVIEMWAGCQPVIEDSEVVAWLQGRGLDPAAVEDFHLARALPGSAPLPRWARFRGKPWNITTHRLIVPMFGPSGRMESVHARALMPTDPGEKAASPAGVEMRGLAMANPLCQLMLSGAPLSDGAPANELVARVPLWVAEGLPDFLTLACNWSDADDDAPAVLGVIAGSWTEALAARVPDGCEVVIATDPDSTGDKYADRIAETFAARPGVRVKRWCSTLGRAA